MVYISGKPETCRQCEGQLASFKPETLDRIDWVFVGELSCVACGSHYLYTRALTTEEGLAMGRPRGSKNKPKDGEPVEPKAPKAPKAESNVHRVTTFGKGGGRPAGSQEVAPAPVEAPAPDPVEVSIPSGPEAESALAKIAALNEKVLTAHEAFTEAQSVAKEKRETWQRLAESLQTLIRVSTRKPNMPLFDAGQAEADQGRLISAVEQADREAEATAKADAKQEATALTPSAVADWLRSESEPAPADAPEAQGETSAVDGAETTAPVENDAPVSPEAEPVEQPTVAQADEPMVF